MERLHLDPLDVLHGRDKPGDPLDIGGIVGQARHQREAHPYRLAHRGQPLGKTQRRSQIAPGRLAIGLGVAALDVEQHEIEVGQELLVGAIAEKARRFDRRVKAHLLGGGQYSPRKRELHHRLAAGDRQAAIERAQRRRKVRKPIDHLLARKRRCRPSDARYRDCGSTSSEAGSRTRTGPPAGRVRRSATTSRRNGRSRTRLRLVSVDRLRPAHRATAPTRRSCRLPASRLPSCDMAPLPGLRSGRGRCG